MENLTRSELQDIVYTVLGEAAGEGNAGMAAVTHVILNRAADPRFPDNPAEVALQANGSGVHQFSAWNTKALSGNDPVSRYPITSPTFRRAELVVKQVMAGGVPDYTYGATQYWSPRGMGGREPYWATSETTEYGRIKIGGHTFLARKPVQPIAASGSSGIAGAISEKKYLQRLAALPSVSKPIVRVAPAVPARRPDTTPLDNAVGRLPSPNRVTTDLGKAPAASELKAWQSKPAEPIKRGPSAFGAAPASAPLSALQVAVNRKAAQMAAARVPPVSNGKSGQAAVLTQRQEQETVRAAQRLQSAVEKEASRIALQEATNRKAASMAPVRTIEIAVQAIADKPRVASTMTDLERQRSEQERTRQATPVAAKPAVVSTPASNGKSSSSNVATARSEQAVAQAGQKLQTAVVKAAAQIAVGRDVAPAVLPSIPPSGLSRKSADTGVAAQRAEQQGQRATAATKAAVIPGAAVVKVDPPAAKPYTVPKYGPAPAVKTEERLQPDAPIKSALVDDIGAMPQFGSLAALRGKVAPMPAVKLVPSKPAVAKPAVVTAKPAVQQRVQQQVAVRAQTAAVAQREVAQAIVLPSVQAPVSKVETLKKRGMTSAQAYDTLNNTPGSIRYSDAADRVNSKAGSKFDSGADSFY